MHVHKDYDTLFDFIPAKTLPKDYGGEELSLDELEGKKIVFNSISHLIFVKFTLKIVSIWTGYNVLFLALWSKKEEEYYDRLDVLETLKVNESLRSAPLENDEILGFHGNFKKLSVD